MKKEEYYKRVADKLTEAVKDHKYPMDQSRINGMEFNRRASLNEYVRSVVGDLRYRDTAVIEDMLDRLTDEQKIALLTVDDMGENVIDSVIDKCNADFAGLIEKYLQTAFIELAESGLDNTYIES